MDTTTEELKQLVISLQAQLQFAKTSELDFVDRLKTIAEERDSLKQQLDSRNTLDTDAIYRRARVEYEAEFKDKQARKEVAWSKRLAAETEKRAQELVAGMMEQERTENQEFRKQTAEELKSLQTQLTQMTEQATSAQTQLTQSIQQNTAIVSALQNQLVNAKQAMIDQSESYTTELNALATKIKELNQTIAFMKTAELDLLDRARVAHLAWDKAAKALEKEQAAHKYTRDWATMKFHELPPDPEQ